MAPRTFGLFIRIIRFSYHLDGQSLHIRGSIFWLRMTRVICTTVFMLLDSEYCM
jgi:hypothetical protein